MVDGGDAIADNSDETAYQEGNQASYLSIFDACH